MNERKREDGDDGGRESERGSEWELKWLCVCQMYYTPQFTPIPSLSTTSTMVQIHELKSEDEYTDEEISDDSDVEQELDAEEEFDPSQESLYDRFAALKDIIPLETRNTISERTANAFNFTRKSSKVIGNIVWVITTSSLLVGLPLALAIEDESRITMEEKSLLAQQSGAQQMLAPENEQAKQQGVGDVILQCAI